MPLWAVVLQNRGKTILITMEDLTLMSSACVSERRCTLNMRWIFALLRKLS